MIRGWLIRAVAWGLRRGVTLDQMREAVDRRFAHRSSRWREDLILDALARNRGPADAKDQCLDRGGWSSRPRTETTWYLMA